MQVHPVPQRHLDTSQRAMVAARLANLKHGQRADYSAESQICDSARTQADAAEILNVGKRSVEHARAVLDDGIPELVEAVESGDIAVSAASGIAAIFCQFADWSFDMPILERVGGGKWSSLTTILDAGRPAFTSIAASISPARRSARILISVAQASMAVSLACLA